MIRSRMCVLAENVVRDADTNTISIFGIVEEMRAQGFPLFVHKIAFFILWERELTDPPRYEAQFSVTLNEQTVHTLAINIEFREGTRLNRSIVNVNGLVLTQPGQLTFRVTIPDTTEAVCAVPVIAPETTAANLPVAPP